MKQEQGKAIKKAEQLRREFPLADALSFAQYELRKGNEDFWTSVIEALETGARIEIEIINLTPHPIMVGQRTFPPSGQMARIEMDEKDTGEEIAGVPVISREAGKITGLPEEAENTIFLVSAMVLAEIHMRSDVFAPDTGATAVRDAEGRITGVTRLVGTVSFQMQAANREREAARERLDSAVSKDRVRLLGDREVGAWRDRRR